ncbi:hypothetical protein [Dethiothermospora halolimnae]|uniref:hypothetical protein n=1 Tax=Dethiothermospora halolimnae TaxID=3114390 RepID=UPI003CCB9BCE
MFLKIIALLSAYLLILFLDLPLIYKSKRKKRVKLVYLFILTIGLVSSLLQILGRFPMLPTKVIRGIVEGILGVI